METFHIVMKGDKETVKLNGERLSTTLDARCNDWDKYGPASWPPAPSNCSTMAISCGLEYLT